MVLVHPLPRVGRQEQRVHYDFPRIVDVLNMLNVRNVLYGGQCFVTNKHVRDFEGQDCSVHEPIHAHYELL